MALAEKINRAIHRLELIPKFIKSLPYISVLCVVASLSWMLILPMDGQYRGTYISENALMPAQAHTYFRESEWNIERGYRGDVHLFDKLPNGARNSIVESWLKDIGYKTSYQKVSGSSNPEDNTETLYAIMHAPRGDDTEAMVLTAPWSTAEGEFNEGGVALTIALARYFSKLSIWSKNIIVVFPKDSQKTLRSWVEAYHTSLDKTAGSIEAALVIEYPGTSDYFDYMEVNYEGLNGQLPNLDLINSAILIASHEGIKISIQNTPADKLSDNNYKLRLTTLLGGIKSLALAGITTGAGCEAFSGWHIQAITIKARGENGPFDITSFGRVIEATFRSVNNLLEKFHQSFFFYLMLTPKQFVSIGTYLPSAVLVSVAFALSSLGVFLNGGLALSDFTKSFGPVAIIFTAVNSFSFFLSTFLIKLDAEKHAATILFSLTLLCAGLSLIPLSSPDSRLFIISRSTSYSLNSIALFSISILITTLLTLHFALALTIAILAFPLTFTRPNYNVSFINTACLFFSSPVVLIQIFGMSQPEGTNFSIMKGLLLSWPDLQSWTWFIVMLGWFPNWLCIAVVNSVGTNSDEEVEKIQEKRAKALYGNAGDNIKEINEEKNESKTSKEGSKSF